MPRGTSYTILLIEPDASLRRLITLGLERRGMQVTGLSSLTALANQAIADPDLLILDIDNGYRDDVSLLAAVQEHPYLATLPTLALAWDPEQLPSRDAVLPLLDYVAKPFDARSLQATIENLLETSAAIEPLEDQKLVPLAAASITSFSGLSPLFTAAGLLLTVIGLMLQPLLAGVGLAVVLGGLLWWTLGQRPQRQVLLGEPGPRYAPSLR